MDSSVDTKVEMTQDEKLRPVIAFCLFDKGPRTEHNDALATYVDKLKKLVGRMLLGDFFKLDNSLLGVLCANAFMCCRSFC